MSVVTYAGHTKRAESWYGQTDIYLGIGRQTPWSDEAHPPVPEMGDTLEEFICMKKAEQKYYVVPDEHGTIRYRGELYRIVDPEDIYTEHCRLVFVSTWLEYGEAPVDVSYRQIGLYTGVVKASGVPASQYVLLPEEIADYGTLEVLANDTVTHRSESKRERLAIIMEF